MQDATTEGLREAAIRAHNAYDGNDDIEVANYDDVESFVERVDGGYWVEARVWVPDFSQDAWLPEASRPA